MQQVGLWFITQLQKTLNSDPPTSTSQWLRLEVVQSWFLFLFYNIITKRRFWGECLFGLYFHFTVYHLKKARRELKQSYNLEEHAEGTMEWCCLLACSHDLLNVITYRTKEGLGSPSTITNFLKKPYIRILKMTLVQMTSACVKLTENQSGPTSDDFGLCQIDIKLVRTQMFTTHNLCDIGDQTNDLMHARLIPYQLNYIPNLRNH